MPQPKIDGPSGRVTNAVVGLDRCDWRQWQQPLDLASNIEASGRERLKTPIHPGASGPFDDSADNQRDDIDVSASDDPMIGRLVSHYRVEEFIGSGGMGVVYRALDTKLRRTAAIKFLPAHFNLNREAKARFIREARTAATLEHESICTIFEAGETADNELFIAMAYYDGNTVRDLLRDHGEGSTSLDAAEASRIAVAVGRGLQCAHERGITHRDIKPENIMVTGRGNVKILDFGVAKIVGSTSITADGNAVGTIKYMSPEQARGEVIDYRTDIWALGAVYYEMLTGRPPFTGVYDQAVIYQLLNEDPPPPSSVVRTLPPGIDDLITRALRKQATDRFTSVEEMCLAIERLFKRDGDATSSRSATAAHGTDDISIAVLPIDDLSEDVHDYFADGLTEEIISDLSRVGTLRVTSRASSMAFKGERGSAREIGRRLGVRYLLDGSVRRMGSNVRIYLELTDVETNSSVWSKKYKGTVDELLTLQEEVATSVADALQVRLSSGYQRRLSMPRISSFAAYDCYLRARKEMWHLTEESLQKSAEYLKEGLQMAGENELLLSGLAYVEWLAVNATLRPPSRLETASEYVEKIFALNPESHHAFRVRGLIRFLQHDLQQAAKDLRVAFTVDANDPDTLFWLSIVYVHAGRLVEAAPLVERLARVDPLNPMYQGLPGYVQLMGGRFELALPAYERMFRMDPTNPIVRFMYAHGLAYAGRTEDAVSKLDSLVEDSSGHFFGQFAEFMLHALGHDTEAASRAASEELQKIARGDLQYSWMMASCYAMLGERKTAIDWLQVAVDHGFINYPLLSANDPFIASLRDEDRFDALMQDVKARWERFEV
ncbi:MAG: protein kinase [Rhodothermia bacterium]|nr:protein kinase [Rhodothermia bacterium]